MDRVCRTKRPYMRLYTADWRDGTRGLSFEVQGFYFRILTLLHDGEDVPADACRLAVMLQCNPRTVAKLLPVLFTAGKLFNADGLLKNPRMEREASAASAPIEPEFSANSARTNRKAEQNQGGQNRSISISRYKRSKSLLEPATTVRRPDPLNFTFDESEGRRIRPPPVIPRYVSEAALDRVRDLAPGWDRQFLLAKFSAWDGSRSARDLDRAFLGWVPRFVKSQTAGGWQ